MYKNIEIIEQFQVTGRGIIAFTKHEENGLPSGTLFQDQHGKLWTVEKRLLIVHAVEFQRIFENETCENMFFSFSSLEKRNISIEKIKKHEENDVFQYLIKSEIH